MIHGDLKGVRGCPKHCFTIALTPSQPNILVDDSGHARIVDFGLSTVTRGPDSTKGSTQQGLSIRWAAPEALLGEVHSKEVDIFAFAMVVIEVCHDGFITCRTSTDCCIISLQVFTGAPPFYGASNPAIMLHTISGKRTPRPTHPTFTEDLWTLTQRCWNQDPHLRPDILEVLQILPILSVSCLFWSLALLA